jgi:hypothetical protein
LTKDVSALRNRDATGCSEDPTFDIALSTQFGYNDSYCNRKG